jgi:hypothetical protein
MPDNDPPLYVLKVTREGRGPWCCFHAFNGLDEPESQRRARVRDEAAEFLVDGTDGDGWVGMTKFGPYVKGQPLQELPEEVPLPGVYVCLLGKDGAFAPNAGVLCNASDENVIDETDEVEDLGAVA